MSDVYVYLFIIWFICLYACPQRTTEVQWFHDLELKTGPCRFAFLAETHNISGWTPSPPQEECLSWIWEKNKHQNKLPSQSACLPSIVSVSFWNSAASKYVPLWLPLCQGCLIDPRWGTKLLWDFFVTCQCLVHAGTQIMSLNSIQGLESKNCLV